MAILGWIVAFVAGTAVVYGVNYTAFFSEGDEKSTLENALYNSLGFMTWGTCLGWVVFASEKGYGGIINSILSWKAFMPLAKLTFAAYLIHIAANRVMFGYVRFTPEATYFMMSIWGLTWSVFVMSVSFILYLLIELPFGNLQKLIFTPSKK